MNTSNKQTTRTLTCFECRVQVVRPEGEIPTGWTISQGNTFCYVCDYDKPKQEIEESSDDAEGWMGGRGWDNMSWSQRHRKHGGYR
jgi:hypothetical protein